MAEQGNPSSGLTRRQHKLQRHSALIGERSSWMDHWKDISQYQQPRAGRFVVTDRNKGGNRFNNIYDNTALYASRTLAAGMMSGMTSPARPWFRLSLANPDLLEVGAVKTWLHRTGVLLREVFARSNTYRALHAGYEELGLFGTWASVVLPDFDNVLHHYPMTIGEFAISTDHRGVVNTLSREFQMTVGQVVGQFGIENVSSSIKNLYDRHALDQWVSVIHLIEPNAGRDLRKKDNRNMRFSSTYFEAGAHNPETDFLSESGFKRFPVLAPRWVVTGQDIYGSSPGMEALGDVKQLQHEQLRKSQGIDYQVNPPIQVPTQYKDAAKNRLPGGVMYVDSNSPTGGIRSAYEIQLNLQHLLLDIQDVRERIRTAYYADLFLMLANDTRSGVTATEVAERHEEKLLMLGPVLERLHNELLSPMIDMAFDYCSEAGILPEVPPELEGIDLNIEFVSTLAQAQRAVSAQGMDRLLGTIGTIAPMHPQIVDKIDFDQVVDDYADMYGVNPETIVPDDVVAKNRAARAEAQQSERTAAALPQTVESAKTVSEINPQGLKDVVSMFQGYTTPGE
jgi:hypothetical protein